MDGLKQVGIQMKNKNTDNMLWMAFLEHAYKLKLLTRKYKFVVNCQSNGNEYTY